MPYGPLNWGDVPTWISVVASVGALIFAALAAIAAYRLFKVEAERDRQASNDQQARQAHAISAWYELNEQRRLYGCHLRNASDSPVYDAAIEFYLPMSEGGLNYRGVDVHKLVPPTEQPRFIGMTAPLAANIGGHVPGLVVAISFRDAAGNLWRRDTNGRLSAIDDRTVGRLMGHGDHESVAVRLGRR